MAAEGLGLAASVAGLLSLGLQVADGISKYLDALDRREDDLFHVKSQNQALITTLSALETVASSVPNHRLAFTSRVVQDIQGCRQGLDDVERLRIDLTDSDSRDWKTRMENKKKKFTYKFHESKMQQLAERLQQSNQVLHLTLSGLELEISMLNTTKLTAIESSSQSLASDLLQIRSSIGVVREPSIKMSNQISGLHESIRSVPQLVEQQSALIVHRIQESNNIAQGEIHHSLQMHFKQQREGLEQRFEQLFEMIQKQGQQSRSNMVPGHGAFVAPSALEDFCEAALIPKRRRKVESLAFPIHHIQATSAAAPQGGLHVSTMGSKCICHRLWRVGEQRHIQLGHVYVSSETEDKRHWPSCPRAKMPANQKRRAWSMRYSSLSSFLKASVALSFTCTFGAGGFSISPSLTYCPTVDGRTDYAFRIIRLMTSCFAWRNCANRQLLLTACQRKLVKIFDEGKALPSAVNRWDENVLHFTARMLRFHTIDSRQESWAYTSLLQLVQTLFFYGVPSFSYNDAGVSPLFLFGLMNQMWTPDLIRLFVQANSESKSATSSIKYKNFEVEFYEGKTDGLLSTFHRISMYEMSRKFAEAHECGPLSIAIVRHDITEVSRILRQSPNSLNERDIYGQSPLHLAAAKPRIMSLLIQSADGRLLEHRDELGVTALEAAMRLSSTKCVNNRLPIRCRQCPCTECVSILLEAGCGPRMDACNMVQNPTQRLGSVVHDASELARRLYVFHMRKLRTSEPPGSKQREQTKLWTRSSTVASTSYSHDTEPSLTSSTREIGRCDESIEEERYAWIFCEIDDPSLADLFYRHGFRARPHLLSHPPRIERMQLRLSLAYMDWLVCHGVDFFLRLPYGPIIDDAPNLGLFVAHFAFFSAAQELTLHDVSLISADDLAKFNKHWETVEHRGLTDGCYCFCTSGGCSPFIWMLKRRLSPYDKLEDSARNLESFYKIFSTNLMISTYGVAIRFATFAALGLAHTCCRPFDVLLDGQWVRRDDVDIINNEQESHLELLETLIGEFEEKAVEYIGQETVNGTSFPNFWSTYWVVRMREVLEKLDGHELTGAERRAGEEIGVQWCAPPEEKKPPVYKWGTLECFFEALDSICPEYNEPWPEGLHRLTELP